jgi:hypothetical protein
MDSPIKKTQFKRVTRRELLKLAPVAALGAFAIPPIQATTKSWARFQRLGVGQAISYGTSRPDVRRL